MAEPLAPQTVVDCYELAGISILAGVEDYTDGVYHKNPKTQYEIAQKDQHHLLLDEIKANKGFRLLDVGCGTGSLLETARQRGIIGTGITISESQVNICKSKGLDVYLYNYKNLPLDWNQRFDGIIANGSLEHFCQPEEAIQGKQDQVYREMFEIFHRLIDSKSISQRVATTAIHFRGEHVDPRKSLKNPLLQLFDDEGFHFSILHHGYGGYYPAKDQLKKCAEACFDLLKEEDATEDYHFTSEDWSKKFRSQIKSPRALKELAKHFIRKPVHTFYMAASFFGPEAWPWQFRGEDPPTRLYRQTWKRVDL